MTFDVRALKSAAFFQDPYPLYQTLREQGRPVWLPHREAHVTTQGTWLFFGHDEVQRLIQDTRSVSYSIGEHRKAGSENFYDLNMLFRDADDHQRLRRLVAEFFTPLHLKTFSADIADITHRQLDQMQRQPTFNLVDEFAAAVPPRVIARLLGTPEDDAPQIRRWTLGLHDMGDSLVEDADPALRGILGEFHHYVNSHYLSEAALAREDSMIARLRHSEAAGQISRSEALAMMVLMFVAGNATVTALASSALWLLMQHPEQWDLLRAEPDQIDAAIEEALRFESPIQRTIFRITTEPIEFDHFRLDKGEQFSVVIGSANRDASVFERPDTFDITRRAKANLAFGRGVHTCLGRQLALVEARIMLSAALERFPRLVPVSPEPVWRRNSMFRELQALQVRAEAPRGRG